MKHRIVWVGLLVLLAVSPSFVLAGTIVPGDSQSNSIVYSTFAPEPVKTQNAALNQLAQADTLDKAPQTALSKNKANKENTGPVQKSTRKAFFLSMLLPGLGEYYVGSKRSILFLGIEAVAWYVYVSNTNKGNDLDSQFKQFADSHWHYADDKSSTGEDLIYNYFNWFKAKLRDSSLPSDISPTNYALVDSLTELMIGKYGISHTLPSTKTQQYYEMIGKYPQFVYGWEDITKNNAALRDSTGKANGNFDEDIRNVVSPDRNKYMDMRAESNDKLKLGQDGIDLMIINRVVSAIDAARLAYHHNKKIDSELSMVRMTIVQKRINDHKVPMLMFTKKF
jgi:hypothetical protein